MTTMMFYVIFVLAVFFRPIYGSTSEDAYAFIGNCNDGLNDGFTDVGVQIFLTASSYKSGMADGGILTMPDPAPFVGTTGTLTVPYTTGFMNIGISRNSSTKETFKSCSITLGSNTYKGTLTALTPNQNYEFTNYYCTYINKCEIKFTINTPKPPPSTKRHPPPPAPPVKSAVLTAEYCPRGRRCLESITSFSPTQLGFSALPSLPKSYADIKICGTVPKNSTIDPRYYGSLQVTRVGSQGQSIVLISRFITSLTNNFGGYIVLSVTNSTSAPSTLNVEGASIDSTGGTACLMVRYPASDVPYKKINVVTNGYMAERFTESIGSLSGSSIHTSLPLFVDRRADVAAVCVSTANKGNTVLSSALVCIQGYTKSSDSIRNGEVVQTAVLTVGTNASGNMTGFEYTSDESGTRLVGYFSQKSPPPMHSPPKPHPPIPSLLSLTSPYYLLSQEYIVSASKRTRLIMQTDGNLVLYYINNIVWNSGTDGIGQNASLAVQDNGDLVVYDSNGVQRWDSGTSKIGSAPYTLTIYDSYIELSDINGRKVWNSMYGIVYIDFIRGSFIESSSNLLPQQAIKSQSNQTMLIMQNNGDLVIYHNPENLQWSNGYQSLSIIWHSGTDGIGSSSYLAIQDNGDLAVYDSNDNQRWDSGTSKIGSAPYTLTTYDSYIELADINGRKVWSSMYGIVYIDFVRGSSIESSSNLLPQQAIKSQSNQTMLIMQNNGDLVVYHNPENLQWSNGYQSLSIIWHSGTDGIGSSSYLAVQDNGDLAVYDSNDNQRWDSGTNGVGSAPYAMTVYDSYIELADTNGRKVWNSMYGIVYIDFVRGSSIESSSNLLPQQAIKSQSNQTMLIMQNNGDLVVYHNPENLQWSSGYQSLSIIWHSGTDGIGSNSYLAVQDDGDLAVYDSNNNQRWDSGTSKIGSASYTVSVYDSYIELKDTNGRKVWNSMYGIVYIDFVVGSSIESSSNLLPQQAIKSQSNQTMLIMQNNGDLVVYHNPENLQWSNGYQSLNIIWHSGTDGIGPSSYLAVQGDGDLVVYDSNDNRRWDSGTNGVGSAPYTMTVYDSYIELKDNSKTILWNSISGIA